MVRAIPSHLPREPLDGTRIAANAGAIAFNAAMMLLLLIPLTAPKLIEQQIDIVPDVVILRPKQLVTPPPPPPQKVETLKVTRDPPKPQPVAQPQQILDPPQIVVDLPPQVGDPPGVEAASVAPPSTDVGQQIVQGATLQALRNPPPNYPPQAVRDGLTGVVELEILVGIDGKPIDVEVVRSSGHRLLDQAAVRVVRTRWTFQPAMRDGQPVQALGRVPIAFTLDH